jgi:hypothetical protein
MGDGEAVTITSSCLSVDVTKKKLPVSVQRLPLLSSNSHLPGKVRAGRKEDMKREDFKKIIKLRSFWKIDKRKGDYKLPSGDKLSKYIRKLVISQMQIDNLLIGENGDLFPGSGGTVNKELKQINDYTIFHLGPVPNEVCTWEQMEERIDHLIFEMLH